MKLGLAADHAGYELKEILRSHLVAEGFEVQDYGTFSADSCDYADFAHKLGEAVANHNVDLGFAFCGSGNGINITVNKHQGVRAAYCWQTEMASLARAHNDANICTLPARYITLEQARKIVDTFLGGVFEGGRHQKRIEKIEG